MTDGNTDARSIYIVVGDGTAQVLTFDNGYVDAKQIEAAYHAARPWTRSSVMNGIRQDARTDPAALQLLEQLTALWGPDGMGIVSKELTSIPLSDAIEMAFAEVESGSAAS